MIAAVVLAAGEASRFGSPKQQLMLPDVLRAVRASSVDEIVVVEGAYELETDARVVRCAEWQRGMGASLRCGLEALPAAAEAAVVVLADGPDLAPEAIDRVSRHGEVARARHSPRATAVSEATPCCSAVQSGQTSPTRAPARSSSVRPPRRPRSSWRRRLPRGLQASGSLSATSFAFSSGDISSRHAVFT